MQNTAWASVDENDDTIKIETDTLEAVIPKKNPKQWMTGIEKDHFSTKPPAFEKSATV